MAGTATPKVKAPAKTAAVKTTPKVEKPKRVMTQAHKDSLAAGREQARIIGAYLDAVGKTRKKRGRQVTVQSLAARLEKARTALTKASPIEALNLTQQIKDIEHSITQLQGAKTSDLPKLEAEFIRVAKPYAESRGISRATFAECGVEKRVLVAAGI